MILKLKWINNYGLVLQSDGNLVLYENGGAVWDTRDSIIQMSNNTNNISYNLNQINNLYNEVTTISGFLNSFYSNIQSQFNNTLNLSNLHVSSFLSSVAGAKIVIQNGQDGGTDRGIYIFNSGDPNWIIYMATSNGISPGNNKPCAGYGTMNLYCIRFRCYNLPSYGFIWENNNENLLMSLNGQSGDLYTTGNIYTSKSNISLNDQITNNTNSISLINNTISGNYYNQYVINNSIYNTISGNYNNYINYQSVINNSLSNLNISLSGKFNTINYNYNLLSTSFNNFNYKQFYIGDITYSLTNSNVYLTYDISNNYYFNFELEIGPEGPQGPQGDPAQNPFNTGTDAAAFISSILSMVGSIAFSVAQEMLLTALGFSTLTSVEAEILELQASVLSLEREVVFLQLKTDSQDQQITKLSYDIIDLFNLVKQLEIKTTNISCDGISTVINGPLQVYNVGSLDFTFDTVTPNNRIVGNTEYLGRSINLN